MTTATKESHSLPGEAQPPHAPHPIDPLRDIDARTTTLSLVFGAIGILLALFLLLQVFEFANEMWREEKIDKAPTTELDGLRADEAERLGGPATTPDGESQSKLRAAIRDYARKNQK